MVARVTDGGGRPLASRHVRSDVVTGVLGGDWRAAVSPWGAIEVLDRGSARPSSRGNSTPSQDAGNRLDWWVAADDRWHTPAEESTLRQRRIDGTPVTETRVKVPSGDVVQRVYSVADLGGLVVIEIENTSTLPVAVAVSRNDVLTSRAAADVAIQGIELPEGAFLLPLSHAGVVRIALPVAGRAVALPDHLRDPSGRVLGALPDTVPTAAQVVRGWLTQTERRGRIVLPDESLMHRVTAERCDLALLGLDDPDDDPVAFLIGVHELARLGADADPWIPDVVTTAGRLARQASKKGLTWDVDRALVSAEMVLADTGERRAVDDVADIRRRLGHRTSAALTVPDGVRAIAWVEDTLVRPSADGSCVLLANGVPGAWLGSSFECYQLPAGGGRTISYAVRWHADRPAALWEVTGDDGLRLRCGFDAQWTSQARTGDALWAAPPVQPTAFVAEPPTTPARIAPSPAQTLKRSIPLRVDTDSPESFN
jgi:hypothetical protein